MTAAEKGKSPFEEYLEAPEGVRAEIVAGVYHASPRPAGRHVVASGTIHGDVSFPFHRGRGGPGGWWIVNEPEVRLGDDIFVPDVAGWRRERLPVYPPGPWCDVTPDWVCEVVSPSTARLDRTAKADAYARHGVGHLWFVDPVVRLLEAFSLANGAWVRLGAWQGDAIAEVPPFEVVPMNLADWWLPGAE